MTHQTQRDRNQSRTRRLFAASVWWLVLRCGPASLYAQGKVPVLCPGTYDQTLPQKNGPQRACHSALLISVGCSLAVALMWASLGSVVRGFDSIPLGRSPLRATPECFPRRPVRRSGRLCRAFNHPSMLLLKRFSV